MAKQTRASRRAHWRQIIQRQQTSTCRRHGIDPERYLTQLLTNLPSTPLSQLDQWLPDVWKMRQAQGKVPAGDSTLPVAATPA